MDVSPAGRQELSILEGNILHAYKDSVGVVTIGVGHTAAAGLPYPKMGMTITADQSDQILTTDLQHIYEPAVERRVKVPLKQHQFDALVLWTYNLGEGNLAASSLLKKVNNQDWNGAAMAFLPWNKAGGKVLPGLDKRRHIESNIFANAVYPGVSKDVPRATSDNDNTVAISQNIRLAVGMIKPEVGELQKDLVALKYYAGKIDNNFGPRTRAAVMAFQRSSGLSSDGIVGIKTYAALEAALRSPQLLAA